MMTDALIYVINIAFNLHQNVLVFKATILHLIREPAWVSSIQGHVRWVTIIATVTQYGHLYLAVRQQICTVMC